MLLGRWLQLLRKTCAGERGRRLWEAGERCEAGEAVVGVVGQAHVPGIRREWARAGAPEVARQARPRTGCQGSGQV